MFPFREGETVALAADYPSLGLKIGDMGTVWMRYAVEPPAYEVKFRLPDGAFGDITLYEEEICAPPLARDKSLK